MQRQREEIELQKHREEMAFRREEKEREMQKEESQRQLELRRMELEVETKKLEIGSRASVDVAGPKQSYGTQRPKIPPLHDPSQVDLYLERFERHATAFGWPESEWASCLSNLLQDEALSIFLSLSPVEGSDYQAVKRVLLQRFGCDRNGFRSKFLTVKPQEAEDFGTFINRARRYFDRWVELSGVSTLEGLSYLVCSEIALQACDEDFVAYIKDRSPSDMVALKSVASAYMDARPNKSFHRKHSVSFAAKSESYRSTVRVADRKNDSRPHESGGRFNYSSKGHRSPSFQSNPNMVKRGASRSPSRDRGKPNVTNKNVGQGQFRPSSGSVSSNVTCFQCGGKGHVRRECPSRPREANAASLVPELPSHCCAAKMDCNPRGGLKIESCKVFDRVSTLLRDSGCNTVGVSKSLVPPDCYTGKSMLVNTFCCRDQLFPTCMINIKTPYFTGDVEACLMDSPIADVILGNINGLSSESSPFDSDSSDVFPNSSFACVVTRAQASKASIGNDLPISNNSTHFNVLDPFSDLPVRQRDDPTLKPWFLRVGLPPVSGVSFRIEDGILKRLHTKSKFSSVQTTVAVPKSLRQVVLSHSHDTLSTIEPSLGFNNVLDEKSDPIHDSSLKFCDTICFAEPTAYVSAISEEDGGEIGSMVAAPPLASENGAVVIDQSLSASQVQDVKELLLEFQDILTSAPGCTNTLCHEIRLTTDYVIRVKPYPLPFAARDFVTQKVKDLLSLGVIEPSDSPYCFPIVVVKKKDGSLRLCIDFRKLNAVTVLDAENIPRQEDLFNQLSHATIFSSCDLCKAYWQVPLHPDSRRYTAFQTPLGLMQWETFIVRSDASDFGVGAVLLQDRDGTLMPCRYASRKLLPREYISYKCRSYSQNKIVFYICVETSEAQVPTPSDKISPAHQDIIQYTVIIMIFS
ncbi:protein saal1-like [Plakobranchus ocellatus]|uniref:Protein saal1-like n=1 Tax=Plakobranchus ocellatus TaxID=259542 RepID=A0AAV3Z3N1_9GAST|nr:protein saal1-like [Plakobranchus ocellatus]